MSIELVMPSNHLILCRPLLLPPSIFPSIRVFSIESVLYIRWPKDWSFSFSISPSNEYSGLIFFRMDWLDLLTVQGTLMSLLQHHSSKLPGLGDKNEDRLPGLGDKNEDRLPGWGDKSKDRFPGWGDKNDRLLAWGDKKVFKREVMVAQHSDCN